jgi:GDP-D-mannose dehydratase
MSKTALINGITGQDGSYLAELILDKGYKAHCIKRRGSSFNTARIDHLYQDPHENNPRLVLHFGDLNDSTNVIRIIQEVQPEEIYNLGPKATSPCHSRHPNTPPTLKHSVLYAYLKPFASSDSQQKHASTKPPPPSSTA